MSERNDVVTIELGRVRELRFGHKALKMMLATMKIDLESFEVNGQDLEQVEKIMFFGLMSDSKRHGENLQLSDMEDLLDLAPSYGEIINKLTLAINKAFDQASQDTENLQQVAKARKRA